MKETIGRYLMVCESALRFPKEVNGTLIGIWCTALNGLDEQDVKSAFEYWIKNESEFPTPAEIRSLGNTHAYRRTQIVPQVESQQPKAIEVRKRITMDEIKAHRKERAASGSVLHRFMSVRETWSKEHGN